MSRFNGITSIFALIVIMSLGRAVAAPQARSDSADFEQWKSCAARARVDRGHSVSELQAMFDRPHSVQQLLQNLQLAWQREFLLEPSFYEQATLERFFASTGISWKIPDNLFRAPEARYVVATIESDTLPGVVIQVQSSCLVNRPVSLVAFMSIDMGASQAMTLNLVRKAFGPENTNERDPGFDQHGNIYLPIYEGSIHYWNMEKAALAGRVDAVFYYKSAPSGKDRRERPEEIRADRVVGRVEIQDNQRRQENQ